MDLPSVAQPRTPEIEFLYSLRSGRTRLGLASTRALLKYMGSPEVGIPAIQVAGTNGKGTTTAVAAALLQAAGLRVGRFTSPHVLRVEERICINGQPIAPEDFSRRVRELRPWIERAGASFFESITAIAALHFREASVDVVVYEVGLGGRLDATTALPAAASIVTGVSWDHESILGNSLQAILQEKLGIARRGVPLFTSITEPALLEQTRQYCEARQTPLHLLPADATRVLSMDLYAGMYFTLQSMPGRSLHCRFLGAHQARNAALAARAVHFLLSADLPSPEPQAMWDGMEQAFLPGRLQGLARTGTLPETILDVAHNQQSLRTTLDLVQRVLPQCRPVIVMGMMHDKRLDGVYEQLLDWAQHLVLTVPDTPRAWDIEQAQAVARQALGAVVPLDVVNNVADAVRFAEELTPDLLLLLGSHFLVAEALPVLAEGRGVAVETLVRSPQSLAKS